jgi:hypothetical protein
MVVTIRPILSTLAPACRSSKCFFTRDMPYKCEEATETSLTPKTNDNIWGQSSLSVCRPTESLS